MNIHEYQGSELMASYGVHVPPGKACSTPDEAMDFHKNTVGEGKDVVVKAQVLSGGRGKGKFSSGLQGGVHISTSVAKTGDWARQMLGNKLVTIQNPAGLPCDKVLVAERYYARREAYFAILLDRAQGFPSMIACAQGGVNIEEVAMTNPEEVAIIPIPPDKGLLDEHVDKLVAALGFSPGDTTEQAGDTIRKLWKLFSECDTTQVEINPISELVDGTVVAMDAKLNFDDNAHWRQKEIFAMRDKSQEDPREVAAQANGYEYVGLDGNIGCMVNGAGLAMATMDEIKHAGGEPANFLDLGGGADAKRVANAYRQLYVDPQVQCILVNIFGGIMRCDIIALGLIMAANDIATASVNKPTVVRLEGSKLPEARKLIEDSGLRMFSADNMQEAAQKVVRIVEIDRLAKESGISINFEIPL